MTLEQFKLLNRQKNMHWFSPDTLRFFQSRILDFDENTGYFISSEKGPRSNSPRKYTVRQADFETGNVKTVGDFQRFPNPRQARKIFERLVAGKEE